jgi:hypothetical protein
MKTLKEKTLVVDNVMEIGDAHRYVNHSDRLATIGFNSRESLIKYAEILIFDTGTVALMGLRYNGFFGK